MPRLLGPIARFLRVEAASGAFLLVATAIALSCANSPAAGVWATFWKTPLGSHTLQHWINDGLMTLFFFVVGLEIKRELVVGELRDRRVAALPIFAALGGMVCPAAIFLLLQHGGPAARGWGVPMATDIAFVVGALALLGPRVPAALRVLLLSVAIADDVGAIVVIAFGYSSAISPAFLLLAGAGLGAVVGLRLLGVRSITAFAVVGFATWLALHGSGVHATLAGVALGLLTPARAMSGEERSPLERLESALHPWVSFGVMPLFALANAGVELRLEALGDPLVLAIAAALLFGKPIGILLFSWIAVSAGLARRPEALTWRVVAAGGVLAGIGFTMSLFIAGLAFDGDLLADAKVGILAGSLLSAVAGLAWLARLLPLPARA